MAVEIGRKKGGRRDPDVWSGPGISWSHEFSGDNISQIVGLTDLFQQFATLLSQRQERALRKETLHREAKRKQMCH